MDGLVLLGWLTREQAIKYLREDCEFEPQLTEQQAVEFWAEKKALVDALPPREAEAPEPLKLSVPEREAVEKFLAAIRRNNNGTLGEITSMVKIDPKLLVVHQVDICLDRALEHSKAAQSKHWYSQLCLHTKRPDPMLPVKAGTPNGWDVEIPHGEYMFAFDGHIFRIIQGAPHISVSRIGKRMILWSGYHRSYARAAIETPDAMDRSVVAALTLEGARAAAPESPNQRLREIALGACPPLLADFFDERLCMKVKLHRKRYELRIRAEVAKINVE